MRRRARAGHVYPTFGLCDTQVIEQTRRRIRRIENDEYRTRLENAEDRQRERRVAMRVNRDDVSRLDMLIDQQSGQPTACRIELLVCPTCIFIGNRIFFRRLLGLPQNLVCYRSCVPFAEGNVLEEIRQRIALAPPEINMGYFPGQVSQVEQERGNSVRYRGRCGAQYAKPINTFTTNSQHT